jgi:SAM-dependent methyltransferase
MDASDADFSGSVPERYEKFMVPMLFAPFAVEITERVVALRPSRVLETAAGTGAVTRLLAQRLPSTTSIVATDLNDDMLRHAKLTTEDRPVQWRVADAQRLPFGDGNFDVVVCQFGVMFFPDRVGAFAEAHRVLAQGGSFVFTTWESVAHNDFAAAASEAIAAFLPDDPPEFIERTPHGYFDTELIRAELALAGFVDDVTISTESRRSTAADALTAARSFVEGTPLRNEIEARRPGSLAEATTATAAEFAARFGDGPVEGPMRAHVVVATKP